MAGVFLNSGEFGFVLAVEEGVLLGIAGGVEELGFGEAAAFEVPGGFEDPLEEDFLEGAAGVEFQAEVGFQGFKGGFEAEGDDESTGGELVAYGVIGGFGFSFNGFGTG